MFTIGLDVHQSRTSLCVLDDKGNLVKQQEVKGDYAAVAQELGKIKKPFQVCYEVSTGYGALYDRVAPLAQRVQVAHPGQLAVIFKSKKKSNKADAKKLAMLMHLNQVPAVHVPGQDVRSWRGLIEHRRHMVGQATAAKNQIRALMRHCGIKGLKGRSQWSGRGIKWLGEIGEGGGWPTKIEQMRLEIMIESLLSLQKRIDRVTVALDEIQERHPGVVLVRTIPYVGPRTAEAFVAYVDDPHRFTSTTIGSYFGLVPREDSTGDHRRLGHITCDGPPSVRQYLTEVAWRGTSHNQQFKEVYERFLRGDPLRKKIAMVAVGHWLCRVMLAMLKTGEVFRTSPDENDTKGLPPSDESMLARIKM